ncbi:MAG TPA: SRPBCC family protein [Thermomicrobiales bacterium]|nr:SRPBCC family protein [Thermomicrobiales bacterium]
MAETTTGKLTVTTPGERELLMKREFNAPRELVFEAWTNPEHVSQWFGPRTFTLPVCEIDLRPGGRYHYVMRGPDGADYPMGGDFIEIDPPGRLVYTDRFEIEGMPERESVITLTFEERDGKTFMTMHTLYQSAEDRDAVLAMGMVEGMTETLDRLVELLETLG